MSTSAPEEFKRRERIFNRLYWGGWITVLAIMLPLVILTELGVDMPSFIKIIAFAIIFLSVITSVFSLCLGLYWLKKYGTYNHTSDSKSNKINKLSV